MSAERPAPDGTFQRLIEDIYFDRDQERGTSGTLLWFVEEVGELVRAIRRGERENLEEEFGAFLPSFAQAIWALLTKVGQATKFDPLASTAIRFLSAVVSKQHYGGINK